MKPKSEKSIELYNLMIKKGDLKQFCDEVKKNLNTDFTAKRMIGYILYYQKLSLEEAADEMLAALSDRNRIMQKKEVESINASWNSYMIQRFSGK